VFGLVLHALAELGVLLLLFEVGLEPNLDDLLRVGLYKAGK
jgi:Kef-type K+ transport system membrane component KefB